MSEKQTSYVQAREVLLAHISTTLKQDQRFLAAWLAGSHARGEQQWFSDLDLHVVVADAYSAVLCAQPWPVGAKTTQERLTLFRQFGEPAVIYEVHANNQVGGTFTYVLYQESAINVDWMLIPQSLAHQEHPLLMLFSHVAIPEPSALEPPSREECAERLFVENRATLRRPLGSSFRAVERSRLQRCAPCVLRWSPSCHKSLPLEATFLLLLVPWLKGGLRCLSSKTWPFTID